MKRRKFTQIVSTGLLAVLAAVTCPEPSVADTIAIIGTGRVAAALGPRFADLGHTVVYGSREPDSERVRQLLQQTGTDAAAVGNAAAAARGDIVILAVPWTAAEQVVQGLGDLTGKIIVDPTNPYRRTEDGYSEHMVATSAGELIQGWLPRARVVKAFNTLSSRTMADPSIAGGPVSIPLVGDDAAAKARVAELVRGIGFEAIDLGPIRYAREVEGMLIVWANARLQGNPFDYHLRPEPAP